MIKMIIINLVVILASINVFAETFVCSFQNSPISNDFKGEIEITRLFNGRYEITGDDGTNPIDCFFNQSNVHSDTYQCESYQGSYIGKMYLPKDNQIITKIKFNYVDEDTGAITRRETLNCNEKPKQKHF